MSRYKGKSNPFDANWEDFEKNFMQSHKDIFNHDLSWLDDYIQSMVSQVLPGSNHINQSGHTRLQPDVFDTHHHIIVRAKIPERVNTRKLKVAFNNANQIRISGMGDKDETVSLPAPGRHDGSKAIFKDDILEIRIPKETNEHYQDIHIQYL